MMPPVQRSNGLPLAALLLVLAGACPRPADATLFRRVAEDDLPRTGKSFGATWADVDGDDRRDLLLLRHGHGVGVYLVRDGLRFLRQDSCTYLPCHEIDQHGTAACDYDCDGAWDLYATVGAKKGWGRGSNELWSVASQGRRVNVLSEGDPLADPEGRGRGALWFRQDDDRYPELLVLDFRSRARLFSWDGTGWSDRSAAVQPPGAVDSIAKWFGHGTAADFDGDGRTDLFLSGNVWALYRNRADGELLDVTSRAGLGGRDGDLVEVVAGDVDNDGDPDLLLAYRRPGRVRLWLNSSRPDRVEFSPGPPLNHLQLDFEVVSVALADLDNDGFLDLYVHQAGRNSHNVANVVARGRGNGTFEDMSASWGGLGRVQALPTAVWPVDPDRDGDLDLVLVHGRDHFPDRDGIVVCYENTTAQSGLTIELETGDGAPHGLGARVRLTTATGTQTGQVRSTGSYGSTTVLPLHFGVGEDPGPYRVAITWPDGGVQELELPHGRCAWSVTRGAATPRIPGGD